MLTKGDLDKRGNEHSCGGNGPEENFLNCSGNVCFTVIKSEQRAFDNVIIIVQDKKKLYSLFKIIISLLPNIEICLIYQKCPINQSKKHSALTENRGTVSLFYQMFFGRKFMN